MRIATPTITVILELRDETAEVDLKNVMLFIQTRIIQHNKK